MSSYFKESNNETTAPTVELLQARVFAPPFIYDELGNPVVLLSDRPDGFRLERLGIVCGDSTRRRDLPEVRGILAEALRKLETSEPDIWQMVLTDCPVPCGRPHTGMGDEFACTDDVALLRMQPKPGLWLAIVAVKCRDRPLLFCTVGIPAVRGRVAIIEDAVSDVHVAIEALDSMCRLGD
ncbi:MAG: hypothetical protein IKF14_09580 [Atopobiaceae bacterium]|nr:hypothetical protein [Atopobiaceae bacterium]